MSQSRYILSVLFLAAGALWFAQPTQGYALQQGEAELSTSSIGKLEVGMQVRTSAGARGSVIKFIRRDLGSRAADLAVVQWDEQGPSAAPLSALEPIDAGHSQQLANR